ncbi:hypothetical protein [Neotamlana nanhaiensis]|uniref:hypothetical protein n=1 Tax=Neotamlana nanhaiensis TaxID=1382798 RepID=UPI0005CC7219|nr:hypothetical protein [Tamlana nanhaiensis]
MITTIKIEIGNFYIYKNYLVVEMNEGITVTPDSNNILVDIVDTFYVDKNFVYITNRINSYAVDPSVYKQTSLIENLVGFAVVSTNSLSLSNAEIEKLFLNKPFELFTDIDEAITWAKSILEEGRSSIKPHDK